MKTIKADLHIHSCLSPCAELDMTPRRIIRRAIEAGIDMIAISDHNSAENLEVALKVGEAEGITVLPAMEIASSEEAHLLAVFGSVGKAREMQEMVYSTLPAEAEDNVDWQVVVNEHDEVLGFNRKLLIGASGIPLARLLDEIHQRGGLAIASHVDRGAFSVMSQFGFVPEDMHFDAFEVINTEAAEPGLLFHPGVPRIFSSDAHRLDDIGLRTTTFVMADSNFEELAMALKGSGGRTVQTQ